jgi:hypothetical protein
MKPITSNECLQRTRDMLSRVTNTPVKKILPGSVLRSAPFPPMNDNQIRNLEGPIETRDFADVHTGVSQAALVGCKTVSDLRDVILAGTPDIPAPKKKVAGKKPGLKAAHFDALPQAATITRAQCLQRTREMLSDETNTPVAEILPSSEMRVTPPFPPMNNNQIRNLEGPIETHYFADVHASVTQAGLLSAQTVGDLRDVIWDGIPSQFKA